MSLKTPVLLLAALVALRILNAVTTATFWQPDEFWQALEPAHSIAYGYGYLTWEWRVALRSALHPLLFAHAYALGEYLGLPQTPDGIVWAPRVLQAVIAALGDLHFVLFSMAIFRNKYSPRTIIAYSLAITAGSAFNLFASTRTFSNSVETALTTAALAYWPWRPTAINWPKLYAALTIAAVSCVFRPTNALIWIFLGLILLVKTNHKLAVLFFTLAIGGTVLGFNTYLDRWFYAQNELYPLSSPESPTWVFPLLNFVKVNVWDSVADFYGTSPWHYYLAQGLPLLLIGYLPFTLTDMLRSKSSHSTLLVVFIVSVFSILKHKEVRFIYPIIPILHLKTLNAFLRGQGSFIFSKSVLAAIILLNVIVATFFNTVHQRGVMQVIQYLRNETPISTNFSVGFLMPCHSTPWQSHLHRPDLDSWDKLWFLTCEPPLGLNATERETYLDVSDQFYSDPKLFIQEHFPPLSTLIAEKENALKRRRALHRQQHLKLRQIDSPEEEAPLEVEEEEEEVDYDYSWPSHLVFFESLEYIIKPILHGTTYHEVCTFQKTYISFANSFSAGASSTRTSTKTLADKATSLFTASDNFNRTMFRRLSLFPPRPAPFLFPCPWLAFPQSR